MIDHHDPSLTADAILTKNTDGTFQAISLLIENGMKRIGFIGDTAFSPSYLERYRGYQRALREHNLTHDPTIEITEIEESQGALFNSLKNIKQMPDAWFLREFWASFHVKQLSSIFWLHDPQRYQCDLF